MEHPDLFSPRARFPGFRNTVYVVVLTHPAHMLPERNIEILAVYLSREAANHRALIESLRGDVQVYPTVYFPEHDRQIFLRQERPPYIS